ncbi:hypothetical protein E4K72_12900 [Oxalobacteraceae bacterium OM1]|nr:hypothetical protein E4K72_12900 [Oxalobacteraceae bacterium OM1]
MSIDALFRQLSELQAEFNRRNEQLKRRSEIRPRSVDLRPQHIMEQAIREEIGLRRARGDKFRVIAAALNAKGLLGMKGGRWYEVSVRNYCEKQGL